MDQGEAGQMKDNNRKQDIVSWREGDLNSSWLLTDYMYLSWAAETQTFIKKASWFLNHWADQQTEPMRHIFTGPALCYATGAWESHWSFRG